MDRGAAARIGGMDRQTLRDWVDRFNAWGPEGLLDTWTEGPKPRLSAEQIAPFGTFVGQAYQKTTSSDWGGTSSALRSAFEN